MQDQLSHLKLAPYSVTLRYNNEWDRWEMRMYRKDGVAPELPDSETYGMFIRYAHDEDEKGREIMSDFRFFVQRDGIYYEVVDNDTHHERIEAWAEHEGDEIASIVTQHQTRYEVVDHRHPVFALRDRWLTLMALGLVEPAINFKNWDAFGTDLPDDVKLYIAALQEDAMRDGAEALAEHLAESAPPR